MKLEHITLANFSEYVIIRGVMPIRIDRFSV